ncbi:MAG: ATP-binding cassette domain-containing protein [Ignavibacteriaceae bacterium]
MNREILLEVKNISKTVHGMAGSKVRVLDNVNFQIDNPETKGQIISLAAASSPELTSLLKIISAVEKPSEGALYLYGKQFHKPEGKIVFIPEHSSSFPWLDVEQNVKFAVKFKNNNPEEIDKKVKEAILFAGLEGYETHFPDDNSLGFRFRISVARAIAADAKILLLDEPLRILHGETKKEIFNLIKEISKKFNITIIIASTNISDSILLSDKIFLMTRHPGKIVDTIDIDISKELSIHSDYFQVLKREIEKLFFGYENIPVK